MMRIVAVGLLISALSVAARITPSAPPSPSPALWWPPQPERSFGSLPNSSSHDYAEYFGRLATVQADTIAAFYGAKGHGALALSKHSPNDCRSKPLQILTVTNGNNSGAGSLRQAAADADDDSLSIILFDTGLKITITARLYVTGKCIIVAGQSAPGGGVVITGDDFFIGRGAVEGVQDVVVRMIRSKRAQFPLYLDAGTSGTPSRRVILDHLSIYWPVDGKNLVAADSTGDFGRENRWWTIQNSLFAEPDTLSQSVQIDGGPNDEPPQKEGTFYRNYDVSSFMRTPLIVGDTIQVIQTIVYNWGWRAIHTDNSAIVDVIAVYTDTGPNTPLNRVQSYWFGDSCEVGTDTCHKSIFITKLRSTESGWVLNDLTWDDSVWTAATARRAGRCQDDASGYTCDCSPGGAPPGEDCRRLTPLPSPIFEPDTSWMTDAERDAILDSVGTFWGVDAAGARRVIRDRVDSVRVQDFYDGDMTPPQNQGRGSRWQVDTFTVDTPTPGIAWADQDGDGLPNAFEKAMLGSTTDSTSLTVGGDCGSNGYLNIEEWLNGGLSEAGTLTWIDNASNEENYRVYRWRSGTGWALLTTLDANVESYMVSGPNWAVGDSLRVHAWNSSGGESDPSNIVEVTCP